MKLNSFPHYLQLDAMDCGPSCLRMIAKYYGKSYSLQTLRARSFITREGVSMLGISDAAESIGFRQRNNFLGTDTAGCDYIVQQNLDNTLSIIQGDWKYIEPSDKPALEYWTKIEMGNAPQPQLYNLSIDPSEKDNVAEAHPDKVKTLSALLEEVKEAKNQSERE